MIKKKKSCSKKTQMATATILSHTTPSKTLLDNPMWSSRKTVSFLFLPCLPRHQNTNPRKKLKPNNIGQIIMKIRKKQ